MTDLIITQLLDTIERVEDLYCNTPDGRIIDSDTILADLVQEADWEENGLSLDLFRMFKESSDKQTFLELFYLFTDTTFEDYLKQCIEETTRPEDLQED